MLQAARTSLACLIVMLMMAAPGLAESLSVGQVLTSPPVTAMLLVSGGIFLILSVLTMGAGWAEFLCFGSFTLLLAGRYMQGQDPWVPLGLLVIGALCLLGEVFVLPGFGVCGIAGLVAIGAMTVLVSGSTRAGLIIFVTTTVLSVAVGFVAVRLLPSTRLTRKLILQPPDPTPELPEQPQGYLPAVGEQGQAATSLRPGGYATFGSERVDVTSENEYVLKGQAIEVIRVEGQKVVVRSLPSSDL
jgi:membrane-bound serine protease (ClpP class)